MAEAHRELFERVQREMPQAEPETVEIVASIAGLFATVAYQDQDFSEPEVEHVRENLARIHGMSRKGADLVCQLLTEKVKELALGGDHGFTRILRERTDPPQRLEILEILVELGAADGVLDNAETNHLRRITTRLGLSQADYNAVQARYRDKLAVLK